MENTETMVQTAVPYNPNQLVTYKVINGEEATYPTSKVVDIEYELDRGRYWRNQWNDISGKVARLENDLEQYLDMDAEEIVTAICDIFGFTPTKEIEFEATATITGTITIPLADVSDFNINDVDFNIDVSAYTYDIDDYNVEVDHVTTL
jgi:hypothetical protein